jgi:tight adherence protein B
MMDTGVLLIVGTVFTVSLLALWFGLRFGTRVFAQRQGQAAADARSNLEGMFIFTDENKILAINVAVLIVLPVLAWVLSGSVAIVGACVVLAFLAPRLVLRWVAMRRLRQFENQLPDALLMMSGALRAGASLAMALDSVAMEGRPPISQEFELLQRELRLGVDMSVALEAMERRVPVPDLALVTAGLLLAREVGANLAETLESLAKTVRARLQMEGKIRSLTAQGKMQGLVMTCLPLFLIAVLNMMEPEAMEPLFHEWYGWVTLGGIMVTISIGYHFIRRITTIDV